MKKIAQIVGLLLAVLSMSSCNTYIGFGRDIQKLGQAIQESGYQGSSPDAANPYGVPEAKP